jgi:Cu-processing system permease protein
MRTIWQIFGFVFRDNLRSMWAPMYMLFFAASTFVLIHLTGSFGRAMVSLMNLVVIIIPLVSTMMASMYFFYKSDFTYLLLSQPIKRAHIFLGIYSGVAFTLSTASVLGLLIGAAFAFPSGTDLVVYILLLISAAMLSWIFAAIAFFVSLSAKDKLRGIGISLFLWLFMAVIYDGLLLTYFFVFSEYPIEQHAIYFSLANPVDLTRVFLMLQLDVSALMGYSGAVFQSYFGNNAGKMISAVALLMWIALPLLGLVWKANRKDF